MIYRFLDFELDTTKKDLRRSGAPVSLSPKPFAVLEFLICNAARMVPKAELMDRFWSANASEAALQTTVRAIRKALGAEAGKAALKTYHGHGFRFVAEVFLVPSEQSVSETKSEAPMVHERRFVAILAVQIDTTGLSGDRLESFLDAARRRVTAEGGTLQRMMIGGFSAVFGLSEHADDAVRRTLRCAWDILASEETKTAGSAVTCGVDAGSMDLSGVGDETVWAMPGEIERGASMRAWNAPGGAVLMSRIVFEQLRDELDCRPLDESFVLLSRPPDRAGIRSTAPQHLAPFVGRDGELALLLKMVETALGGRGQAVVLQGPAGIGKSRLVQEFLQRLGVGTEQTVTVPCLPRLAHTPLSPIRHLLTCVHGPGADHSLATETDRALFKKLVDPAGPPSPILAALSEQVIQRRSRDMFVRVVQAWCDRHPRVLIVEDAHWIDPASRAYFSDLIAAVDAMPVLIVVTTRPTERAQIAETVLGLPPLGPSDCMSLLSGLAGNRSLSETRARSLVERSSGNPFFLEELARVALTQDAAESGIPETVQAVVETRIAGLPAHLRRVVYAIAVIGPPAQLPLLAELLALDEDKVSEHLDDLVNGGFLTVDAFGAEFRHMLLHDTAYGMISASNLVQMHKQVAQILEAQPDAALPEALAWHWQEAGVTDRAILYWTKASNAALSRSSGQAAILFARKGLDLLDTSGPEAVAQEQGLQLSLATALMARKGYAAEEVGGAYYRALDLSGQTGSIKAKLRSLLGLWVHTWTAGRLSEALSHGRELLKLAEIVDDPHLRLQGHGGLGSVLFHTGDFVAARQHLTAGVDLIAIAPPDTVTAQNAAVTCLAYRAWIEAIMGTDQQMQGLIAQSDEMSRCIDNPFAVAIHRSLSADVLMSAGDVDACADLAKGAIEVSSSYGYPFWLGTGLVIDAWVRARRGDVDGAIDLSARGIEVFERTGARIQRVNWFGVQAEVYWRAGRMAESKEAASHALDWAQKTGDIWYVPRIRSVVRALECAAEPALTGADLLLRAESLAPSERLASRFTNL